jgi:outer membrane protein assembly factor BamA
MMSSGLIRISFFAGLFFCLILLPTGLMGEEETKEEGKGNSIIVLPVLSYSPETKFNFGVGGRYIFRLSKKKPVSRPSSITMYLSYTQLKQFTFELEPDIYLKNEDYHFSAFFSFSRYTYKFFGIGNNTPADWEEYYTTRNMILEMEFRRKIRTKLYAGIFYEYLKSNITDVESGGLIEKGDIPGSGKGHISGLGVQLNWDARDNIYYPKKGFYYFLSLSTFRKAFGSDYDFTRWNLDFRRYFCLFSKHVLAFQGYVNTIHGDPPFQKMSLLGGTNLMRGYYMGRYRDKNMIAFQMEYRLPVWKRWGLAGFAGFGDVADSFSHLSLKNFKYSLGFGIRFLLLKKENLNIRFDFGFGRDSSGVYLTVEEAF